jgi:hypothetical protein
MRAAELATLVKVTGRRRGGWYDGLCPAHPDKHTSFSFRDGDKALVVKCRAGCTLTQILAALGHTVDDLQFATAADKSPVLEKPQRRKVATYDYRDEHGILLYQVMRFDLGGGSKTFLPRIPLPDGSWDEHLPEHVRRVCYRIHELKGQSRVAWNEGEGCADTCWNHGIPATTGQGGSNAWRPEYAAQLRAIGIKEVIVLPDADKPGEKYAQQALMGCRAEGLTARLVRLWPNGPEKSDVTDWFGVGHTVAEFEALCAPPTYSIERRGDGFVTRNGAATIDVTRLYEHRDGAIDADFWASVNDLSHWSRLNMAAPGSRQTLAKHLMTACPGPDWISLLDYTCQAVVKEIRTVQPAVPLKAQRPQPIYNRFLIEGIVPLNMCTVLYGDGASLKSLMALAIAVAGLRGEPIADSAIWCVSPISSVLMLDWEANAEDHDARLWGLCAGYGLDPAFLSNRIHYFEMTRPLHEALPQIKKQLTQQPADLVIVDSLLRAAGEDPIDIAASTRVMGAIRELHTTTIAISHISHDSARSPGQARIIGSVMYNNTARSAVECRAEDVEIGPGKWAKIVTYSMPKSNVHGKWGPHALRFVWSSDDVIRIESDTPDDSRVSLGTRILTAMNSATRSVNQLARETGASKDTIRKELTRLEKRGMATRVSEGGKGAGDETQWGRVDMKRGNEAWQ